MQLKQCFILGNGPTLPVNQLYLLSSSFTMGVNRILKSGFTPTVHLFIDDEMLDDTETMEQLLASPCLKLKSATQGYAIPKGIVRMPWFGGWPDFAQRGDFQRMYVNGSSACTCAMMAHQMGFEDIVLLGMSGTVGADGRTDFYGVNKWHASHSIKAMNMCTDMMMEHGEGFRRVDNLSDIDIVKPEMTQDEMREHMKWLLDIRYRRTPDFK
jgi:hypothetical protein